MFIDAVLAKTTATALQARPCSESLAVPWEAGMRRCRDAKVPTWLPSAAKEAFDWAPDLVIDTDSRLAVIKLSAKIHSVYMGCRFVVRLAPAPDL